MMSGLVKRGALNSYTDTY